MAIGTGSRSAWPSNDDLTFFSVAVIVFGLAFFAWYFWTFYHAEISWAAAVVLHWEIGLVRHFTPALDGLDRIIASANLNAVRPVEILTALNQVGYYLRLPAIGFILVLAVLCFALAAPGRFTRKLDLSGLMREHLPYFAGLSGYVRRRLRLVPLDADRLRPLDPALHPREWVMRHAQAASPEGRAVFDDAAAARALTAQLGSVWQGVSEAPGHVRVLYVAFGLHLEQRRRDAQEVLSAMARAMPQGGRKETAGPPTSYVVPAEIVELADGWLKSRDLFEEAARVTAAHAYTAPALMSLLTAARRRAGVLAPPQFLCLKMIDRSLWYALHSLGFEGDGPGQMTHPNPRVEAAGARDHWACERIAGEPLIVPSVERAVAAVRSALVHREGVISLEAS